MIVIVSFLAGALIGTLQARRKKGNMLDMAQYGAVYAIIFAILGLLATIIIERMI